MSEALLPAWQQPPLNRTLNLTNRGFATAPSFVFGGVPEAPVDNGKIWKRLLDLADLLAEIDWMELWELIQPFFQRQISSFCAGSRSFATHSATQSTKGYIRNDVTPCFNWRARRDSNSRPLGS